MNTRSFGPEDIKISEIGLGCWQIGHCWGDISDESANNILNTAFESGITFWDTADVYGEGRSESLIGKFLKDRPGHSVFVATKVGRLGLYPDGYTKAAVKECLTESAKRLQMDCLPLVQLHCIPIEVIRQGEIVSWLDDFKQEGLIARYGTSVESMEEAQICIDSMPELYSLQIIFNLFRQKPIRTLFPTARQKKIGIIARVPLASGLLSGKFTSNTSFGDDDHRKFNKDGEMFNVGETFAGLPFEKGLEVISKLKELLPENPGLAIQSLRWIIDHPEVSVVIPGASRPDQVLSNARAGETGGLTNKLHKTLYEFYETEVSPFIRGPY